MEASASIPNKVALETRVVDPKSAAGAACDDAPRFERLKCLTGRSSDGNDVYLRTVASQPSVNQPCLNEKWHGS